MEKLQEECPKHIAIIMDGNRRWAKANNLTAKEGHKAGADNLEKIAIFANKLGIKYLTVYAFSTENWRRTEEEIGALMLLLRNYLKNFSKRADTQNIKINVIGDISKLDVDLQDSIKKAMEKTSKNTGMVLNIAFNYGGRAEILRAVKKIAKKVQENKLKIEDIDEKEFEANLYTSGQDDPDLLIRTSGELRTSNFLPWQITYSEFYFPKIYWPDFNEQELLKAIEAQKKKNIGGTK